MRLTNLQLANRFWELLANSSDTATTSVQIAAYLTQSRRTKDLPAISREMSKLKATKTGQLEIASVSRFPLSEQLKHDVAKLFSATNAKFDEAIDPNAIGGASFKSFDKRLDLSLRGQLNRLKYTFAETK